MNYYALAELLAFSMQIQVTPHLYKDVGWVKELVETQLSCLPWGELKVIKYCVWMLQSGYNQNVAKTLEQVVVQLLMRGEYG